MSESDSDLDFESADEDADFASNIKTNIESEISTKNTKEELKENVETSENISKVVESSNIVTKEDDTRKTEISSTEISDTQATTEVKENLDASKIKISKEDSKEEVDSSLIDSEENKTDAVNESVHNVSNEPVSKGKTVTSQEKDTNISKKKERNASKGKKVLKEKDKSEKIETEANQTEESHLPEPKTDNEEPEYKPDKPRVLLRIEKKRMEKSQLSKEASHESKEKTFVETKEKASDLVNILREEPPEPPFPTWGFSSWGTSLLSTAASSVSTFSNQVSQGIGTVLETVESTLGAPPPEELASALSQKKKEASSSSLSEDAAESDYSKTSLLPDVSSWTKVFESTGSKVLFGGLDTLELIGKKTMDILTESDPGLRKKRAMFSDKVNVAELIREARAKAEEQDRRDGLQEETVHYSQIFDEKQGLVHLEALEMLSNQSQVKLQRLLMRHSKNVEVRTKLEEIKSICEDMPSVDDISDCENFDDFETVFKKHTLELSLSFNIENIMKVQRQINDNIAKYEEASEDVQIEAKEIFKDAICSLAEFTAKCIEIFHKVSELIIVQSKLDPDIEHCVTNLTGLTTVMCIEVNNVSTRYHKCLEAVPKSNEDKESSEDLSVTTMATNLYVEAANSNKYIQDAYLMLVPVLQVHLLENL